MTQSRIERMQNDVIIISHGKLALLTIAAAAAAVIVTITSMTSSELPAAGRAGLMETANTAPPPQTDASAGYFPGQYVNQATEASEHIQAF